MPDLDPHNAVRSHREFERWYEERYRDWPEELQKAGHAVKSDLWILANNPPSTIEAMKEYAGKPDRIIGRMVEFIRLYAEWSRR